VRVLTFGLSQAIEGYSTPKKERKKDLLADFMYLHLSCVMISIVCHGSPTRHFHPWLPFTTEINLQLFGRTKMRSIYRPKKVKTLPQFSLIDFHPLLWLTRVPILAIPTQIHPLDFSHLFSRIFTHQFHLPLFTYIFSPTFLHPLFFHPHWFLSPAVPQKSFSPALVSLTCRIHLLVDFTHSYFSDLNCFHC